jgi:hypothetical protein
MHERRNVDSFLISFEIGPDALILPERMKFTNEEVLVTISRSIWSCATWCSNTLAICHSFLRKLFVLWPGACQVRDGEGYMV